MVQNSSAATRSKSRYAMADRPKERRAKGTAENATIPTWQRNLCHDDGDDDGDDDDDDEGDEDDDDDEGDEDDDDYDDDGDDDDDGDEDVDDAYDGGIVMTMRVTTTMVV